MEQEEVKRDDDKSPASPTRELTSPGGFHLASLTGPNRSLSDTESDGHQTFNDYWQAFPKLDGNAIASGKHYINANHVFMPGFPEEVASYEDGFHLASLTFSVRHRK